MAFSRQEEMIWREVNSLSGDLSQVADNLKRNAAERLKEAEALQKAKPGYPTPCRVFDLPSLVRDVNFIRDRLELLLCYISGEKKEN